MYDHLMVQLVDIQKQAKELSEEVFHQAIDTSLEKYSKVKNITPEEIADFAKDLKKHWKDIKKEIMPTTKKVIKKK